MFSHKTGEIRPIFPRLFPYTLGIFPKWSEMGVGKAGKFGKRSYYCVSLHPELRRLDRRFRRRWIESYFLKHSSLFTKAS